MSGCRADDCGMTLKKIHVNARADKCNHQGAVTTVNHGLRRTVCRECGRIDIGATAPSEPGTLFRARPLRAQE